MLAAAAIAGGSVRIEGIGKESIQGDARFADVLAAMGCRVKKDTEATGLAGGPLKGILDVDCGDMPDIVPTLAAVALERLDEGRLLTADKGAGSFFDLYVKVEIRAQDPIAEEANSSACSMAPFRCWTAKGYSARTYTYPCSAPMARAATSIPSITRWGSPSRTARSIKAPLNHPQDIARRQHHRAHVNTEQLVFLVKVDGLCLADLLARPTTPPRRSRPPARHR
jgi:hypothetical protein